MISPTAPKPDISTKALPKNNPKIAKIFPFFDSGFCLILFREMTLKITAAIPITNPKPIARDPEKKINPNNPATLVNKLAIEKPSVFANSFEILLLRLACFLIFTLINFNAIFSFRLNFLPIFFSISFLSSFNKSSTLGWFMKV